MRYHSVMANSIRRSKAVTLADVAKRAGLAVMTVSRYLNGYPNITEKTARKVKDAIDELGYRPNQAARILMGQPSNVIGLIIPNLANPFFASIAHSVQQTALQCGYLVWIAATNDESKSDTELIQRMRDHQVDGILLASSPGMILHKHDLDQVPLVAIDRPVKGITADYVTIEDRMAAHAAVEHLLSHGYQRIACFGLSAMIYSIEERIIGYQEAMKAKGLAVLPYAQCEDKKSAKSVICKLLSGRSPVQAIFPANATATILALEALNDLNISVPEGLALFSYGDIPLGHVFRPPISAVRQPTALLGEIATRHLLELIAAKRPSTGVRTTIPASLVIRQSCGCAAHSDIPTE